MGKVTYETYGTAYAILPNGDIVTADGKPCSVDGHQLDIVEERAAKEGREITFQFRKADEAETAQQMRSYDNLVAAFNKFKEMQPKD